MSTKARQDATPAIASGAAHDGRSESGAPAERHVRPHHHTAGVARRLARAEGHLAAVRRMVTDGRDCPEILLQLAAVRAALDATAKLVLADHMESCLRAAAHDGDADQVWSEFQRALETFIR